MANEFIIRKGFIALTGSTITGSLNVTAGITGSLLGTASYATNALSASYFSGSVSNAVSASYAATASIATSASYALNGGVTQLLAGPNVTLSPTNGLGQVTITAALSGSTSFNTATGSYGSFYDTTTQTNPVANVPRSMSFNTTDITNGVSISGSTSPYDTYIKIENPGVYDIQFSAQLDKIDAGKDEIIIWLRKNGIDLTDTATSVSLTNNNDKVVAAWNWFVNSAANDYYQLIWYSADTNIRLLAEPAGGGHPGIPSVILTANRVDQFLSNTGSFSGSFNGNFTGSLLGTASYATNALSSSYSTTSSLPLLGIVTASAVNTTITFTKGNGTTFDVTIAQSGSVATASYALFAQNAESSSYAATASYFTGAVTSASYAQTASYLNTLNQNLTFNGNLTLNGTASITYLNTIYETASVIYSSGSNQFGDTTSDIQTLIGTVIVSGSQQITGSLDVSEGITGSLLGTASYAVTAINSSYPVYVTGNSIVANLQSNPSINTVGSVYIGSSAGNNSDAASDSMICIGNRAGSNSAGINTIMIGNNAGNDTVSADYSIFIGAGTGQDQSGIVSYITALGYNAGANINDTSAESVFIGSFAGDNSTVTYSNFIGYNAGALSTSSFSNFIGEGAGAYSLSTDTSNFIGGGAGSYSIVSSNSTFIGTSAGGYSTNTEFSNFIGYNAGYESTLSVNSNFIGNSAGLQSTGSSHSNFIGPGTGVGSVNTTYSTIIGPNTAQYTTDIDNTFIIGNSAGYAATGIQFSNFIGDSAGAYSSGSIQSNFIGTSAGQYSTASFSNFIGFNAGGYTNSSHSLHIGYNAGLYNLNNNNVIIGTNVTLPSGVDSGLNIGGILFGRGLFFDDVTAEAFSGSLGNGKIGINVVDPQHTLDVSGSGNFTDGLTVTGSLIADNITGSLLGTASYALTASYLDGLVTSASYAATASYVVNALTASYIVTAQTASYVLNAVSASYVQTAQTASYVLLAQTASYVTLAQTASYVLQAVSASYATRALSSSYAGTASVLLGSVTSASYAATSSIATTASFSLNTFTNLKTSRFEMGVSSTTTITTGAKGRKTIGYNGTIVGWRLVTDQSTTMTLDVWKANNAIPTVTDSITGTAPISITAAQLGNSTTLTGWTTSVAAGDVFIVNVDSNNNATYFSLELDIVLTNS